MREIGWHEAEAQLSAIRRQVFIVEQHVPEPLEWDGRDEEAIHLLACTESGAVGCARLLAGGQLGRMAVLEKYRGQGIGQALLQTAIAICHARGWHVVTLSAQTQAVGFYARAGFNICSKEYPDAGIPHRDMRLILSN